MGNKLAITGAAAALDAFVTKKVAVAWRATQQFAGTCLLKALGDGFACLLHEKLKVKQRRHSLEKFL